MLFLAFSDIQSRDFLAVSPIPGLRSGSNAKAFSTLTYPGLLDRPLLLELCFAIPNDLHGKFADMIWLILAQASLINEALPTLAQASRLCPLPSDKNFFACAHDVVKSRQT